MSPKIKNVIMFIVIAGVLVLVYFFFFKPEPEEAPLVSSSATGLVAPPPSVPKETSAISQEFLSILLNVKNIKINDAIFSDPSFGVLRDSSIELIPSGNEGRANPFAPIGFESAPVVNINTTSGVNIDTTTGTN